MDASQVQNWMHYIPPDLGTSRNFKEIPLSPQFGQDQSANTSGVFSHTPLEHEIAASRSVWNDSGISDELTEQHIEISTTLLGQGSPAVRASSHRGYRMNARDPGPDEAVPRSAVLEACSNLADLSTLGTASAVTLVEEILALDTASGPTEAVKKLSFSGDFHNDQTADPPILESDISDRLIKSSEQVNSSNGSAELAISTPPARSVTHAPFTRDERPEPSTPSSLPEFFEIPIPIFPFQLARHAAKTATAPSKPATRKAGTPTKANFAREEARFSARAIHHRNYGSCMICRARKIFRAMPTRLWRRLSFLSSIILARLGVSAVLGSNEAGGNAQKGVKRGGEKLRFWRFWS